MVAQEGKNEVPQIGETPEQSPEEAETECLEAKEEVKLYKSTRFKGYLTLTLASSINFNSALQSEEAIHTTAVAAASGQRRYATAVSMLTVVLCVLVILGHFDRYTPLKGFWLSVFGPKAKTELYLIAFLVIWWLVATCIQTGVRGIAGDGKGQYNVYFSTWACFSTAVWTLERWLVSCGHSSFQAFMASWPHRAPGWIAIFVLAIIDLLCVLDLFLNWETAYPSEDNFQRQQHDEISQRQWEWLLFTTAFTVPFAAGFILAELLRTTTAGKTSMKSEWETILEGIVLAILALAWIPSVIVATTPGGVASFVGNAYFFTWLCTIFVMETSVWWIHDWRKRIQTLLEQQAEDYRKIQQEVLEKGRAVERNERISHEDCPSVLEDIPDDLSSEYDAQGSIPDVMGA